MTHLLIRILCRSYLKETKARSYLSPSYKCTMSSGRADLAISTSCLAFLFTKISQQQAHPPQYPHIKHRTGLSIHLYVRCILVGRQISSLHHSFFLRQIHGNPQIHYSKETPMTSTYVSRYSAERDGGLLGCRRTQDLPLERQEAPRLADVPMTWIQARKVVGFDRD